MQILRFINRFDDSKKICSPNMWVRWQHSCSNAVPVMIDYLLRTSPEMVTWVRNGHIKSVVLLFMYYWMEICYKCWKNSFCLIKIMILNLDKIKNCIAFAIGNVFRYLLQSYAPTYKVQTSLIQIPVTKLRPNLQSANISYSMQKRLLFKIDYVCKIP